MSWEVVMYFEGSQVRVSTVVVSKSSMSKFSKLPSSLKACPLYTIQGSQARLSGPFTFQSFRSMSAMALVKYLKQAYYKIPVCVVS